MGTHRYIHKQPYRHTFQCTSLHSITMLRLALSFLTHKMHDRITMTPPWFIITGGPSSGKTTIINILNKLGYATLSETARIVIEHKIKNKIHYDERSASFQQEIFSLQMKRESTQNKHRTLFLDRAMPDSLAYLKETGTDINPLIDHINARAYRNVFFMEQLPTYNDGIRETSTERINSICRSLLDVYNTLNIKVIHVRANKHLSKEESVSWRTDFILDHVNNK